MRRRSRGSLTVVTDMLTNTVFTPSVRIKEVIIVGKLCSFRIVVREDQ